MDLLSERVDHMLKTQVVMQEMFNLLAREIHRLDNTALPRAQWSQCRGGTFKTVRGVVGGHANSAEQSVLCLCVHWRENAKI